jgi:hypothetical protein
VHSKIRTTSPTSHKPKPQATEANVKAREGGGRLDDEARPIVVRSKICTTSPTSHKSKPQAAEANVKARGDSGQLENEPLSKRRALNKQHDISAQP